LSGVTYYKKFSKEFKSDDAKESQLLELVDEIKYSVENLWKSKNTAFSDSELSLEFTAPLKSLKQLNKLRNELLANASIKKLNTLEISSKVLKGRIYYTGSLKNLQEGLEDQSIFLKEILTHGSLVTMSEQQIFNLSTEEYFFEEDFCISQSNQDVCNYLRKWPNWDDNIINIFGT